MRRTTAFLLSLLLGATGCTGVSAQAPLQRDVSGKRAVPPGLPSLPIELVAVHGVGKVQTRPSSAVEAAIARLAPQSIGAPECTVNPGTGKDTAANGNTRFASVAFFARTDTACIVAKATAPFTEQPFDLLDTDPSQRGGMRLKAFYANGHAVTIRTGGPDLASTPWARHPLQTNSYCSPAAFLPGSGEVTRVLLKDTPDPYGFPAQLRKHASLETLGNATTPGWFWDARSRQLCVNTQSDVASMRTLRALYLDAAGNSRVVARGTAIAFDGVRFEGVQLVSLDAASRRPSFWLNKVELLWAPAKGWDGTHAGDFIATSLRLHASRQDGANASTPSVTGSGLIQLVNPFISNSGDVSVYPPDGTLQGVSAHGGSHNVIWGGRIVGANGQGVADGTIASHDDRTWLVGVTIGPQLDTSAYNMQWGGTAGSRKVYMDTVVSAKAGTRDVQIDPGAELYVYQTSLPVVHGGTTRAYQPGSP